ncbi:hypothetical protein CIK05_05865 [Bdellovibrio sp. qaytius]|nr:hypothetical protein CIK05_05865 [Bdellovibrio sp. qaytius]
MVLALWLLYWTNVETEPNLDTLRKKFDKNIPHSAAGVDKSSVKVFLVEDEPTTIILTEAMLNQLGYSPVGVATSYETAMAALKVTPVDIVLVDLVLSGSKTGFDVIKELNRLNIPCVLITGTVDETTLNKLVDLDVYGFLPKPYDQLALATTIQLALKKFTRLQDRIFEEADAIKSRLLATQALESEFGISEKLHLIKKGSTKTTTNKKIETFSYHNAVRWTVVVSLFLVTMAIVGYIFNIPFLLMYSAHASSMKINTCLCILLLCFSLSIENSFRASVKWKTASFFSICLVLTIVILTALEYVFTVDFGIDELFVNDNFVNEFNLPGRMAIPTTISIFALSTALLFNRFKNYKYSARVSEVLAVGSFFLAMVGAFGHIFNQIEFNRVIPYLAQSRVTLAIVTFLSLGVLFLNPKKGIMSIFSSSRVSAKVGRKMLYWLNSSMVLISLAIYYLVPQRFENLEVIFTLITTMTTLTVVILWATRKQIKNEIQIEQTIKLLENRERELEFVLKRVPHPVAVLDKDMRYVLSSRQWIEDFDLKEQSSIGRSIYETFPLLPDRVLILFQRAMGGEIVKLSDEVSDFSGNKLVIRGEIRPWFDIADQIAGIIVFFESVNFLNQSPVQ